MAEKGGSTAQRRARALLVELGGVKLLSWGRLPSARHGSNEGRDCCPSDQAGVAFRRLQGILRQVALVALGAVLDAGHPGQSVPGTLGDAVELGAGRCRRPAVVDRETGAEWAGWRWPARLAACTGRCAQWSYARRCPSRASRPGRPVRGPRSRSRPRAWVPLVGCGRCPNVNRPCSQVSELLPPSRPSAVCSLAVQSFLILG